MDWLRRAFGTGERRRPHPVVEVFAIGDRAVLIPTVTDRKGERWPDPVSATVISPGADPKTLADAVRRMLAKSPGEGNATPPKRRPGDVIDIRTHELVGLEDPSNFFSKVKYGQIVLTEGQMSFYPSRAGGLDAELARFVAEPGDDAAVTAALEGMLGACELR